MIAIIDAFATGLDNLLNFVAEGLAWMLNG